MNIDKFIDAIPFEGAKRIIVFSEATAGLAASIRAKGLDNLIIYDPATYGQPSFGVKVIRNALALHHYLMTDAKATDRTVVAVDPEYRALIPTAHDEMMEIIRESRGMLKIQENSVGTRLPAMIENVVQNLPRFVTVPPSLDRGLPLLDRPAFIVSAGPSLDKNIHLLKEASGKGYIFTVNTCARAVSAHADIDWLVCIENIDSSAQMLGLHNVHATALDLTAHPNNFEHAPGEQSIFFLAHKALSQLSRDLQVPPLPFGACVATAAFSLARHWGANPIVLVGQDLAFPDGRMYANGTGREGFAVHRRGATLAFEMPQDHRDHFAAHEIAPPPKVQPAKTVAAWGGEGTVDTTYDMVVFRRWFEQQAQSLTGRVRLINATEGGASIEGFVELPLSQVLRSIEDIGVDTHRNPLPVPSGRVDKALKSLRNDATYLVVTCERFLRNKSQHHLNKINEHIDSSMLINAHAAGMLARKKMTKNVQAEEYVETIRSSAKKVLELLP